MAKEVEEKVAKTTEERVVNTTESIKEKKTDAQLQSESFKKAKGISASKRKPFKCSSIYASLYPDGFVSTYQGIVIELYFDNSVVELPEVVINYIEKKLQEKADKEAEKLNRFKMKKQEKIGEYEAE